MTDSELLESFHNCSIPPDQWNHRAHVRIAYLFLQNRDFDEALALLRAGIQKLNCVYKIAESPTSGYNETTTRTLLQIIAAIMHAYASVFPVKTADEFFDTHPQLHSKHILRLFYSPGRRMHPLAKTQFIEPDLAPLPMISKIFRSPA